MIYLYICLQKTVEISLT